MFTLTNIIGTVPVGSLQPTGFSISGFFTCPGVSGGVDVEVRLIAPVGVPTTVFTATTSTGGTGMPPVDSVTVPVTWAGATCGEKITFEVRGLCGGQWTAWQQVDDAIRCYCPRIGNIQAAYGACSGMPAQQSVTITATVILDPGPGTTPITCDFGDGAMLTRQVPNPATVNTPQTLTFVHVYDAGRQYSVCLRSGECPMVCTTIHPTCNACCDEVTLAIDTQPLPCLGTGGGAVTVGFSATLAPAGCTGPFEWQVRNLTTNSVIQPFTAGGATFSHAFSTPGNYKVNVRVAQDSSCDDPTLSDSVTFDILNCPPCAVGLTGPTQTACPDGPATAAQTYTAMTSIPFAGSFAWEVVKAPAVLPFFQMQGGSTFSFAFPGPGTYRVTVSLPTPGCPSATAASSITVTVPPCTPPTCPPGQHPDANGNCVPDTPPDCPPGQHRDANGSCVPDMPPPPICPPGQHLNAAGACVPDSRISCDALLWIALILIALSGVLGVVGCILKETGLVKAAIVVGIIALVLLTAGVLLYLLWWAICRFFTACSVIISALHFIGLLIAIFAVVAIVLAILGKLGLPVGMCWIAAIVNSAIWGVLLYITYRIAVAVGCITENPNGPPPPTPPSSSSSGLSSAGGGRGAFDGWGSYGRMQSGRPAGLGDVISRATAAMGIHPCASCHERAARLNAAMPFGRSGT